MSDWNIVKENWKLALGIILVGLFVVSVFASKHYSDKADAANAMVQALKDQAREFGKQVQVERDKAKAAEEKANVHLAQEKAQAEANIALKTTVAELRRRLAGAPPTPENGGPVDDEEREGWKAAVKTRDDLVAGLDKQVEGLEAHVAVLKDATEDLKTALDHANTALDLSDKEKLALYKAIRGKEIAYDAVKHANTMDRITYFGYGFLAGLFGGARVRF